jgi:hypothetical protein
MTALRITVFALTLFSMASPLSADESAELAKVSAKLLERAAAQDGSKISYADGKVRVSVTPVSENALENSGRFISAARFEISIDGTKRPELTFGAIGIGESREDATKTAVVEWYMAAGQSVLSAIGDQPTETKLYDISVYAGLMGIRGERPEGWLDGTPKMNRRILASLNDLLPTTSSLNSIDIKIVVKSGGSVEGQCVINGKESPSAVRELQKLEWPATDASYMFKQAYIVSKRPKGEQDGARQPATAVDSKSEGSEKPKPESDVHSQ